MKQKILTSIAVSVLFIGCASDTSTYQTKLKIEKLNFTNIINQDFNQKINHLAHKPPVNPNSMNFVRKGNVVIDKDRKLMWQDDKSLNSQKKLNWKQARQYCKNLKLSGHSDWRLPTIQELSTIVDLSRYNPAIAKEFKNVKSDGYWTNTSCADNSYGAWLFGFFYGDDHYDSKYDDYYVRCVRKMK